MSELFGTDSEGEEASAKMEAGSGALSDPGQKRKADKDSPVRISHTLETPNME